MLRQNPGVTAEPSGDRIVALDASGNTMVTLNAVGAVVWNHLSEPRDVDQIVGHLEALFPDVDGALLRDDAEAFIAELLEADLIHDDQV